MPADLQAVAGRLVDLEGRAERVALLRQEGLLDGDGLSALLDTAGEWVHRAPTRDVGLPLRAAPSPWTPVPPRLSLPRSTCVRRPTRTPESWTRRSA